MTTHFRKTALAQLISTTLLAGATTMAYGQESSEAPVDAQSESQSAEEVVVHGIRSSLTQALDQKRNSDTFIDVIVAEDIGKLPDDNLAETLQRIPGIQIEREDGEGVNVTIRGIRKNRLEVNGRTLLSPNGRGSSAGIMNYLPSEIVGSVRTSKVLTADMSDGALGGTINVKTRKPLDKKGFWGGATVKSTYAEMNGDQGLKGSALISNSFNDDTMGISVGVVHEDRPITEDKFYSNGDWRQGAPYKDSALNTQGVSDPYYYQYDLRYQRKQEERTKSAVTTAFQWRPSAKLDVNADLLYATYDANRSRAWAGIILEKTLDNYVPESIVVDERDARVAGSLTSKVENSHERYMSEETFLTGGINATWYADSGATVFVEYGHSNSQAQRDQMVMQLYTKGPSGAGVPVDFDLRGADIPSVTIPDLTDPADFVGQGFYDERNILEADEDSFRVDINIPFQGVITSVKTGLKYSAITAHRTKHAKYGVAPWDNQKAGSLTRAGIGNTPVQDAAWMENALVIIDMSDALSGSGANVPNQILVVDTALIGSGVHGFSDAFYDVPIEEIPEYTSTVDDNIAAIYARADFDIAGWTGNAGLRYADTSTSVHNYALVGDTWEPMVKEGGYQDILPSLVVKKDLTDDLVLRMGASKIINRPSTSTLGEKGRINLVDDDPATPEDESEGSSASFPNPDLKPQRGVQYDAALEWYFADTSALAAAVFYKTLDRQIVSNTELGTIPGYGDQIFSITTDVNGGGGKIKGFEIAYNHDFRNLPSILSNMGAAVNYTYLDNTTDEIDERTGDPIGLQGVSKNSVNVQVYYEDDKLSGRLLFNWRDDYFDRVSYNTAILNKGEPSLDASVKYEFTDSLSLQLQAVNLLDTPKQEYAGWDQYVAAYAETGTRFTLGMSMKF
jgi:iron complex outermembrane receptor protein